MQVELGDEVKDRITGFVGVAVGRAQYLTGCTQFGVAPEAKDNKYSQSEWFDETRLEVTVKRKVTQLEELAALSSTLPANGGPATDQAPSK